MPTVRVLEPERLSRTATFFSGYNQALGKVGAAARRDLAEVWSEARTHVDRLRGAVAAAMAAEAAADEDHQAAARARTADLRERLRRAEQILRRIEELRDRTIAELDRLQRSSASLATAGSATLTAFAADLAKSRATFATAVTAAAASAPVVPVAASTTDPAVPHIDMTAGPGTIVALADVDDSDSRVTSASAFTKVSLADVRVGLSRLQDVVLPAVRAGRDRSHFEQLDREHPATGDVTYAKVFDAFFGSRPITLSRDEAGRLTVVNGYHRIWAARRMGVTALPARIVGQP